MSTTESTSSGYAPSMGDILDQYEELSETVSRDPGVAADNRRLADLALRRAKAEAWADCERSMHRWFNDPFADDAPRNPYSTTHQ